MKTYVAAVWLFLLAAAVASQERASWWLGWMILPIAAAGFLHGPAHSFLLAVFSSLAAAVLLVVRTPPDFAAGVWAPFGLLPFILWNKRLLISAEIESWNVKKTALENQIREIERETKGIQSINKELEDSIHRITELYGLSKQFLATLEEDTAIRITEESIQKWLTDIPKEKQQLIVQKARELLETGPAAVKDLVQFFPEERPGTEAREKWGIMVGQLALGLQRVALYKQIQRLAIHDSLTGLMVRRHFMERLEEEVARSKRLSKELAFLMIDLDEFKKVNDTYGHLVGDVVLREVAERLQKSVREVDLVGRYGGEEFGVVLPETDMPMGAQVAERIRQTVEQTPIPAYDERIRMTVSVGVSVLGTANGEIVKLIEMADEALYKAKNSGRNRVVCS
ncbi:MAG: GGDEF domain-containing protein [Candidatus Omnitrophica bacterium]|nr:GGDEF domain-containing protein [Candidatus Omnitrophota bacterium]